MAAIPSQTVVPAAPGARTRHRDTSGVVLTGHDQVPLGDRLRDGHAAGDAHRPTTDHLTGFGLSVRPTQQRPGRACRQSRRRRRSRRSQRRARPSLMGTRSLPAVDRTDTPQPCCGEWGVPKTYPQRSATRISRASPGRHGACPSGSGRAAAGYSTADPLPLREVLRGTGQQVDLQGLCSRAASRIAVPTVMRRCSVVPC